MKKRGTKRIRPINRDRKRARRALKTFTKQLATFLSGQAQPIAAQIIALRDAAVEKMTPAEAKKLAAQIAAELDLRDWSELVPGVEQLLLEIGEDGVRVAFKQLGVTPASDVLEQVNTAAAEWARDRAAELVGMRVLEDGTLVENPNAEWAISDSTREMLRGDIETAIEEGMSTDDLAGALEARYAFSAERAQMIARTELADADVQGNLAAYRDSGVVEGKEWILGSEHPDIGCECEDAAAMGVQPLDSDWGGIGDPPAHPNCVCDVMPVLFEADDG